ncbi:MAG: hypothetical protein ACJAYB_003104, partial [Psychromonas sp.]
TVGDYNGLTLSEVGVLRKPAEQDRLDS